VFVMSGEGINPVWMSRTVRTVVRTVLDIHTGFIPSQLMTNTSGYCCSL